MMKKLLKEYEAPLCDVVEVSLESAVLEGSVKSDDLNNASFGYEKDHSLINGTL